MSCFVYLLANKRNGTLYTGVTGDLIKRIYEHKQKMADVFTKRYGIERLVYYEITEDIHAALEREKHLKKWNRAWKIRLIQNGNPQWKDLYEHLVSGSPTKAFPRRGIPPSGDGDDKVPLLNRAL